MSDAGPRVLEGKPFRDDRGFFVEAFNKSEFGSLIGQDVDFVQDNHSRSYRGVLRGLHYQLPPAAQGKLVRVSMGAIFDVAVDVRRTSPSFGQWEGFELSEDNLRQLWVPSGFAHGFLVLSDIADVLYKTTTYYAPELDRSIRWDDPQIGIEWPLNGAPPLISPKDATAPSLAEADVFD